VIAYRATLDTPTELVTPTLPGYCAPNAAGGEPAPVPGC
jgi:hypothetical protein